MTAGATVGHCKSCGKRGLVMPLHLEKGGPLFCLQCGMEWQAKHTRRRKFGRIVAKATRLYLENGGKASDVRQIADNVSFARLGFAVPELDPIGYAADTIGIEVGDITSELLIDILQLTHPDKHPPERQDLAKRVTQQLLALQPFTFPAPKPTPAPPLTPACDASSKSPRRTAKEPSQSAAYPCALCADQVPYYYCAVCRAEWEKRQREEREKANAKQRAQYARRQQRRRSCRPPKPCAAGCGAKVEAKRRDAKYCSPACRQRAHRNHVTDKALSHVATLASRNGKAGARPLAPASRSRSRAASAPSPSTRW